MAPRIHSIGDARSAICQEAGRSGRRWRREVPRPTTFSVRLKSAIASSQMCSKMNHWPRAECTGDGVRWLARGIVTVHQLHCTLLVVATNCDRHRAISDCRQFLSLHLLPLPSLSAHCLMGLINAARVVWTSHSITGEMFVFRFFSYPARLLAISPRA